MRNTYRKKVEAWQKYLQNAGLRINVDKTQVTVNSKEVGNGIAIHDVRGSIKKDSLKSLNIFDLIKVKKDSMRLKLRV